MIQSYIQQMNNKESPIVHVDTEATLISKHTGDIQSTKMKFGEFIINQTFIEIVFKVDLRHLK